MANALIGYKLFFNHDFDKSMIYLKKAEANLEECDSIASFVVSCSVVRRCVLPDAFLAADGLFETFITVLDQMGMYEPVVRTELNRYLPFLMTTTIMMAAVKRGVGRETAHEVIKEHAVAVSNDLRNGLISTNDLLDRLGADGRLMLTREEIQEIYDANAGDTGMAAQQVDAFAAMVEELATRFPDGVGYVPGAIL